ncbi:hypothetical protein [Streptomyces sp. NPDC020951]|uniref:hypothetical protein n=1 Tax=Streptomyces sp. NPDC020951 TaxID=3365104 RepID=UPI0037A5083B
MDRVNTRKAHQMRRAAGNVFVRLGQIPRRADHCKALFEASTASSAFIADAFLTARTTAAPSGDVRRGNHCSARVARGWAGCASAADCRVPGRAPSVPAPALCNSSLMSDPYRGNSERVSKFSAGLELHNQ